MLAYAVGMSRRVVVAVCLLLGCTADHAPADSIGRSPEAFVDAWLAARCDTAARCESVAALSEWAADCHPQGRARWERVAAAVAGGDALFDGALAGACIDATLGVACADDPRRAEDACRQVLVGGLDEGTPCDLDWPVDPCAPHLGCRRGPGCAHCERGGAAGESCVGRSAACAAGLDCLLITNGAAANLVCGRVRVLGESCQTTDHCFNLGDGSYAGCSAGTCVVMPVVGVDEECGPEVGNCPELAFCSYDPGRFPDPIGAPTTCIPYRALGQSCDTGICAPGLRCDGTCMELDGGCTTDAECTPSAPFCVSGRCDASAEGARCGAYSSSPIRASCPPGLECALPGLCERPVAVGEPCDPPFLPCGERARCVGDLCLAIVAPHDVCGAEVACPLLHACSGGHCEPLPEYGGHCTDSCYGGLCSDGLCVHAAPGDACDYQPDDCEGPCIDSTCALPAEEGAACSSTEASSCAAPLECLQEPGGPWACALPTC